MEMPDVVKAYFDAERLADPDALSAVFAADAVVRDEGVRHEGVPAIRSWWLAAKAKYQHVASPIEMAGTGDVISVCAIVTGKFPNSPAALNFLFTLQNRNIVELEIYQ
jgi:hypothetical protein